MNSLSRSKRVLFSVSTGVVFALTTSATAQNTTGTVQPQDPVTSNIPSTTTYQSPRAVPGTVGQAGRAVGQIGNTAGATVGQLGNTLGNTAGNVVGGLQPTLQPVTQGAGSALNNLTQPDTVAALLEFLAGVIPNHIEAHVNLDALQVEKITLDIQGVDLRNLRVDLLVANSRNANQVRPAMGPGSASYSGASGTSGPTTITVPSLAGAGSGASGGASDNASGARTPSATTPNR